MCSYAMHKRNIIANEHGFCVGKGIKTGGYS